jgi:ATP-dependent DNA helicase RecQ
VASGDYPTLFLTQAGAEVLRGEAEVTLVQPRRPQRSTTRKALAEAAGGDVDSALFERLRTLRRELARERSVPPYLIASDKTLAHLAAHRPQDHAGLLATPGIGEKKAQELGPALLEVLKA